MKKTLLLLFVLLIITAIPEQVNAQNRIGWGIRGGVNFSNIVDTDFDPESRLAFLAGLYLNYHILNSPVSIQPEVLYTQKGFEARRDTYQFDYVEVPILARFDFINESKLLPYVYFGPHISFKVNADTPPLATDVTLPPIQTSFNEGDINPTNFGITIGGGLDFGRFELGARYSAGLTKISDDDDVNAKNGVFSIVTGIGL